LNRGIEGHCFVKLSGARHDRSWIGSWLAS